MGKEVRFPTTPDGWAISLSMLLTTALGKERFPVDVVELAKAYSAQAFPQEPITFIGGGAFPDGLDGMLVPNPEKNGEWGILYNNAITSTGRQNFTLAHEFGHYLLHRHLHPSGFKCDNKAMHEREVGDVETEANTFASRLLMPADDFRKQMEGQQPNLALMRKLADRYQVSVTAAMLQWLELTTKRAMVVSAVDGFIDWTRSSQPLFKSRVFYRARQETIELPQGCLAAQKQDVLERVFETTHAPGVWAGTESVSEEVMFQGQGRTVSLLIYPDHDNRPSHDEEHEAEDTYDRFIGQLGRR